MGDDIPLSEAMTDSEWLAELEKLGEEEGYYQPLGDDHAAVYSDDSLDTLLVYFDSIPNARATNPNGLPHPLVVARELGWSHIALFSNATSWFREERVYGYFDRLIDEGFLEDFERVIFFGVGAGGYAASAFSVAAPGSTVIAVAPQATLDPTIAGWDDRFHTHRRLNFKDRFGYAPDMLDAAEKSFVVYDPMVELDAMHATLFRAPNTDLIRLRNGGAGLGRELMGMNALRPLFSSAERGTLNPLDFYQSFRLRQTYLPYLRSLLTRVHTEERHLLTAILCRAALEKRDSPRLRHHLDLAVVKLREENRELPAPAPKRRARLRPVN